MNQEAEAHTEGPQNVQSCVPTSHVAGKHHAKKMIPVEGNNIHRLEARITEGNLFS